MQNSTRLFHKRGPQLFFKKARDQAFFHTLKGTGLTGAHCLILEAMMENSRNATEKTSRSGFRFGWLIGGAVVVVVVAMALIYGGSRLKPPTVIQGSTIPDRIAPHTENQPQPQGPTGPTNTTSGGAPAAGAQGDTPAGMQAVPQESKANAPTK